VESLRHILTGRAEVTTAIETCASDAELALSIDFDSQRFEQLTAALPVDLKGESERWMARFNGSPVDAKPFIVCYDYLILDESATHSGIYTFGSQVMLDEPLASQLQCGDFADPSADTPWNLVPQRVMTPEDFAEIVKMAEEKCMTPREICFWRDVERNLAAKRAFMGNGVSQGRPLPVELLRKASIDAEGLTVRAKAKKSTTLDREYLPGEAMEIQGRALAWDLANAEAIESV
jgi:hypothetical protein